MHEQEEQPTSTNPPSIFIMWLGVIFAIGFIIFVLWTLWYLAFDYSAAPVYTEAEKIALAAEVLGKENKNIVLEEDISKDFSILFVDKESYIVTFESSKRRGLEITHLVPINGN